MAAASLPLEVDFITEGITSSLRSQGIQATRRRLMQRALTYSFLNGTELLLHHFIDSSIQEVTVVGYALVPKSLIWTNTGTSIIDKNTF